MSLYFVCRMHEHCPLTPSSDVLITFTWRVIYLKHNLHKKHVLMFMPPKPVWVSFFGVEQNEMAIYIFTQKWKFCNHSLPLKFFPAWTHKMIFWRTLVTKHLLVGIDFYSREKNTMEVHGYHQLSSKYYLLCSTEERNSYMFGIIWGLVNDDIFFIFGVYYSCTT